MRRHADISAGILVGGFGRRMGGRDKARLERQGGSTFLEHIVHDLRPRVQEVVLLGRTGQHYPEVPCRLLADAVADAGPLAGLARLLEAAATPWCLLVACDLGDFDGALVDELAGARGDEPIVVPCTPDGAHWTCALYRRTLAEAAAAALGRGERALYRLAADAGVREVQISSRLTAALRNVNVAE